MSLVQSADVAGQPPLVHGANLLQQDKGGPRGMEYVVTPKGGAQV